METRQRTAELVVGWHGHQQTAEWPYPAWNGRGRLIHHCVGVTLTGPVLRKLGPPESAFEIFSGGHLSQPRRGHLDDGDPQLLSSYFCVPENDTWTLESICEHVPNNFAGINFLPDFCGLTAMFGQWNHRLNIKCPRPHLRMLLHFVPQCINCGLTNSWQKIFCDRGKPHTCFVRICIYVHKQNVNTWGEMYQGKTWNLGLMAFRHL